MLAYLEENLSRLKGRDGSGGERTIGVDGSEDRDADVRLVSVERGIEELMGELRI